MMKRRVEEIIVGDVRVTVSRKPIRSIRLSVRPPAGEVRISVPLSLEEGAIRSLIAKKASWIKKKRDYLLARERISPRGMSDGEWHYYLGRKHGLRILPAAGRESVTVEGGSRIVVRAKPGAGPEKLLKLMERWHRAELAREAGALAGIWERALGVKAESISVRRMKTKWGSCNATARTIRLNLELIKMPPETVEFVIVHELCHLRVPNHGPRFVAMMDKALPDWRARKNRLNAAPAADAELTE